MTTQQRGEETRASILAAAEECFAQHGYDGTGLNEICRRAGVTKGAFYHHFPSKQAVFMELFNRWLEGIQKELSQARLEASTVPESLLRMADMAQPVFTAADGRLPLFVEFWNEARHDDVIRKVMIAPYRQYRSYFSQIIQAGIKEGTLKPVRPDLAAQVIVSLAVGLVLQSAFDPAGTDWSTVTRSALQMLLEGLQKTEV